MKNIFLKFIKWCVPSKGHLRVLWMILLPAIIGWIFIPASYFIQWIMLYILLCIWSDISEIRYKLMKK